MDQLFSMPSEWLCCSTSEVRFWDDQYVRSEQVTDFIDTPQAKRSLVDLASQSSSLTSSGPASRSSGRFNLGRVSSVAPGFAQEASVALNPSASFPLSQFSGSSYGSGSNTSMDTCTSPGESYYTSTIMSSPEVFEPATLFAPDGDSYWEGLLPTDLPCNSQTTSAGCEQVAIEEPRHFVAAGVSNGEFRMSPGRPQSRASTSEKESSFVCQSCQCEFKRKSSLLRHRKEKCEREGERGQYQCNSQLHYGCTKTFKRRCGLRDHYKRLKLTEEQAVARVREQYPKGMHRR